MSSSPKRKSESPIASDRESSSKKVCLTVTHNEAGASHIIPTTGAAAPDALIDHHAAIAYWSATAPTVAGVLGGFPQVSRVDLQGSKNFLRQLRRTSKLHPPGKKLRRAVDCGAGIGRITAGFLANVADVVDIVEPVTQFTDQIRHHPSVGSIYNVGLESWYPSQIDGGERERGGGTAVCYDLIWNQWCVGQLKDAQFVAYLRRLPPVLSEGGWIVVKENLSNLGEDVFDREDSSVTRTDEKFRKLFSEAGLRVVRTEVQGGMLEGLYPVRSYALQPK